MTTCRQCFVQLAHSSHMATAANLYAKAFTLEICWIYFLAAQPLTSTVREVQAPQKHDDTKEDSKLACPETSHGQHMWVTC